MLKTAIIGISGYGGEHLRLLLHAHARGLLAPTAAVVINPDEVQQKSARLSALGCRIYDSVEAMWAGEGRSIELCMIPSAIATHYPFTKLALEHGSHVFVEKPVCGTVQEARELVELATARGLEVCVGFQDLYSQQVRALKRRILDGEIGRLTALKGWGSWPRPVDYYTRNDWAGQLTQNGGWTLDSPLNNAMAHFLMMLLFWGGATEDGFAEPLEMVGDLFRAQDIPSFDTASLRLKTREGPEVFYAVTHSGRDLVQPVLRVEGTEGSIEWSHAGRIRVETRAGVEQENYLLIDLLRENMIESVHQWITSRSGKVVLARDAVMHVRIVNALHDFFPIRDFPPQQVEEHQQEENRFRFVADLVPSLEHAFSEGRLLSEVRPDWGPGPANPVRLKGYHTFAGGYPVPVLNAR